MTTIQTVSIVLGIITTFLGTIILMAKFIVNQTTLSVQLKQIQADLVEIKETLKNRDEEIKSICDRVLILEQCQKKGE